MAGFRFLFSELIQETKVMATLSEEFLDPNRIWVLSRFLSHLRSIRGKPEESVYPLELRCLRTIPSNQYDRNPGKEIYAVISGIWELQPWGKRSDPDREVEFCGKASTKIKLYASDDSKTKTRLAIWSLELGAEDSPGCYVHAHILGDTVDPRFPKSVPIPRLPSLFVTPMSAIEFVLGELFQNDWPEVTSKKRYEVYEWHKLQKKWLQQLFSWYQDQIEKAGSFPWIALKKAKPEDGMFL